MTLGVMFGLDPTEAEELRNIESDSERLEFVERELEEKWDAERIVELETAWDPIHRVLGEFPPHTPWFSPKSFGQESWAAPEDHGEFPLNAAVLGGESIYDDDDYIMRFVPADQVKEIAAALKKIDGDEFARRYWKHCEGAWPEYGQENLDFAWQQFERMRGFYERMAKEGRAVLFTAPQ